MRLFPFLGPYTKADPLDGFKDSKGILIYLIVVITLSLGCIYLAENILHYLTFHSLWGKSIFILAILSVASLVYALRKSHKLILLLIIFLPLVILEFFLESHFMRDVSDPLIWKYNKGAFGINGEALIIQFSISHIITSVLISIIGLWLSRLIAKFLGAQISDFDIASHEKLFSQDRIKDESTHLPLRGNTPNNFSSFIKSLTADRDFWILRILGIFYMAYLILIILGSLGTASLSTGVPFWPDEVTNLLVDAYANPILLINSLGKISMMVLLCFIGAFNLGMRYYACLGLTLGHMISTIFCFLFYKYFSGEEFLLISGIVDGFMVLLFLYISFRSFKHRDGSYRKIKGVPNNHSIAAFAQQLTFRILSILFISYFIAVTVLKSFEDQIDSGFAALLQGPESMLVNTLTFSFTISLLAYLCTRSKALRTKLQFNLTDPLIISFVGALCYIAYYQIKGLEFTISGTGAYLIIFLLVVFLIILIVNILRRLEFNVDHLITSLHPSEAANAQSAIVSFFGEENVDKLESLKNLDSYLSNIRGRKRGLINFPFFIMENIFAFILGLRPRFSTMSIGEQSLFLKRYIFRSPAEIKKSKVPALSNLAGMLGLSIRALCSISHLTTRKGQDHVGFIQVKDRDRITNDPAPPPPNPRIHPTLQQEIIEASNKESAEKKLQSSYDYVIIGSGPAGAVAAFTLAIHPDVDPSKILLVERGRRVSQRNDMNEDELDMLAQLYKEGGLQQTKKFDMVLLQGEALGGTSVINNAVCFEMTAEMKEHWTKEYDLNLNDLDAHYKKVGEAIDIHEISSKAINQKVRERFINGVNGYNEKNLPMELVDPVLVNATGEIGDGMWNIGNKNERKNSMAVTYIPWAEALGIHVLTNTNALRFYSDLSHKKKWNTKTADRVLLNIGKSELKEIDIHKALIIAGGCLSSSHFLMRSNITENVGNALACNYAFPFAFEYEDQLHAYDGTQITIGALEKEEGLIFETYFNPPGSFSLSLPFNLQTNKEILEKYNHYLNFGILIGSEHSGTISPKASPLSGRAFQFELQEKEIKKIKSGILKILEIGKASGAKSAIIPLKPGLRINFDETYQTFVDDLINHTFHASEIVLSSAHPQGGNMMCGSNSKHVDKRVVDENFRLDDFKNAYVLDASVFPSSIAVNPQWTVMALSSMAAENIAKTHADNKQEDTVCVNPLQEVEIES